LFDTQCSTSVAARTLRYSCITGRLPYRQIWPSLCSIVYQTYVQLSHWSQHLLLGSENRGGLGYCAAQSLRSSSLSDKTRDDLKLTLREHVFRLKADCTIAVSTWDQQNSFNR